MPKQLGQLAPLVRLAPLTTSLRKLAMFVPLVALAPACLDRPVSPARPTTTNLYVHTLPNHVVDKADLLFMIDNSGSMADKQQILAKAVPVLVERLATPRCLDDDNNPTGQVADVSGHCTNGHPEFKAVKDIHVGIVTSSLGSHGGTECTPLDDDTATGRTPDDRAELLPTAAPAVRGNIDSWNQQGFLAWDPGQNKNNPPGDGDIRHFSDAFGDQVQKAGENGCGFESSLEAWYRFLVDPEPPSSVSKTTDAQGNPHTSLGPVNQTLLAQRKAFLRPDSLLAVVMLTDENDCSIDDDDGAQGWLTTTTTAIVNNVTQSVRLPRASSACAASPNDRCCHSCGAPAPDGCTPNGSDSACQQKDDPKTTRDQPNLRCFDQKRRFGIDLLYPLGRYIDGLTKPTVVNRENHEVPNPIFAAPPGEFPRSSDLVLLAGIVGVPWQDIATDDSLTGDGLTYLTADELDKRGRWATILGGPGAPPSDPLMQESIAPRTGTNPVTGAALAPPSAAEGQNPINSHEQNVPREDDLQFACTFPLPTPRQCTDDNANSCDCVADDADKNSPLCRYPTPGAHGTQYAAKAYPGLRELGVLQGVKNNAIVASICPKHTTPANGLTEAADASYGYNPAVAAMGGIISSRLARQCLPRPLTVDTDPSSPSHGQVPCAVVEALPARGNACSCDEAHGRIALGAGDAALSSTVREELAAEGVCGRSGVGCNDFCYCKIAALEGTELSACQNGSEDASTFGYCYVDPAQGIGSPTLVADCPTTSQRSLHFVGEGLPANGSTTFVACIGSTFDEDARGNVTTQSSRAP